MSSTSLEPRGEGTLSSPVNLHQLGVGGATLCLSVTFAVVDGLHLARLSFPGPLAPFA